MKNKMAAFCLAVAVIVLTGSVSAYEGLAGQYEVSFNADRAGNQVWANTQENPDMYAFFMDNAKVIVFDYGQNMALYNNPQDMLTNVYGSGLRSQPINIVIDGKNGAYAIGIPENGIAAEYAAIYFADAGVAVAITATDKNLFDDIAGSVHVVRRNNQGLSYTGALSPVADGYQMQLPTQQSAQIQTVKVGRYTVTYAGAPPSSVNARQFGVYGESLQAHTFKVGADANIAIISFNPDSPTASVNFPAIGQHGYIPNSILTILYSPLLVLDYQIQKGSRTVDDNTAVTGYAHSSMDQRDHYTACYGPDEQALVLIEAYNEATFEQICNSIHVK